MINFQESFTGSWEDRLSGLLDLPIQYEGSTVLDIGSNMGIIGYEICKLRPRLYHGVERSMVHYLVSKMVFKGVATNTKIDWIDISQKRTRERVLEKHYDIIMYLAVHQHIRKQRGARRAANLAKQLFFRCNTDLVFRGPDVLEMVTIATDSGFTIAREIESSKVQKLVQFTRA